MAAKALGRTPMGMIANDNHPKSRPTLQGNVAVFASLTFAVAITVIWILPR
jgi:hypothetical protein